MATITAAMVKSLRETTGAGMMDCKAALAETDGDVDKAVDWLRTKGLAKAAKKSGRVAAEGLVSVATEGRRGAVIEVNSETDFVARNENFQSLVKDIAGVALEKHGDLEAVLGANYPGKALSIEEQVKEMVGSIGENMTVRRAAGLEVDEGVVTSYIHNAVVPGAGKIGVLVALKSSGDADKLAALGRQIAMHVAAVNPIALTDAEVPAEAVERERQIFTEQAKESGKPDNVIEKMIEGRIRKFYEEVVLLKQPFVMDGKTPVEKAVAEAGKEIGAPVELVGFVRFGLGEGIEKEESDFAAEVAAAVKGD